MTTPECHEKAALRQQIAAHERELNHRANVITTQADRIAALERELAGARAREANAYRALLPALPCNPRSTCFPALDPTAGDAGSGPFGF